MPGGSVFVGGRGVQIVPAGEVLGCAGGGRLCSVSGWGRNNGGGRYVVFDMWSGIGAQFGEDCLQGQRVRGGAVLRHCDQDVLHMRCRHVLSERCGGGVQSVPLWPGVRDARILSMQAMRLGIEP